MRGWGMLFLRWIKCHPARGPRECSHRGPRDYRAQQTKAGPRPGGMTGKQPGGCAPALAASNSLRWGDRRLIRATQPPRSINPIYSVSTPPQRARATHICSGGQLYSYRPAPGSMVALEAQSRPRSFTPTSQPTMNTKAFLLARTPPYP